TEIYLQALEQARSLGRRGIVLVPEIALTAQTIRRFAERFPGQVAVVHSGLSPGQLYDQWRGIADGRYAVVIGPRSALFAPQPDLGLIVIDEEHEDTYKQQEPAPRYHTREVAEELARLYSAVLIMGSATPSLESYHRALQGRYRLLELPQRASVPAQPAQASSPPPLPAVEVVDMRQELRAGQRGIFSRRLLAAMGEALARGEQAILFLNRRGSAFLVQCRDCGYVPRCSGCDLAYVYHSDPTGPGAGGRLLCHHCRRQRQIPDRCPQCQGRAIPLRGSPGPGGTGMNGASFRPLGMGTQRVEEEMQHLFPKARCLRWDRDVAIGYTAHERILSRFLSGEADVLIGTQMVAKGLDIPRVGLVGVVLADVGLHLPDYRSAERTFQLLTQVAGRAGRRGEGLVIIQTYSPGHYAVAAAAKHDYRSFYADEIAWRLRLSYPPFARLARLVYAHTGEAYAMTQASRLAGLLRERRDALGLPDLEVRGPAPSFIAKQRGRHRWQIVLRGADPGQLLRQVPIPPGWTVDIDPVSLL
ncbi:MAG TPA: primosomal protein N', partial [Dehalococcoidia bacterium]|nr:primosomal protein N' [Dehalococcoidia bacterium]